MPRRSDDDDILSLLGRKRTGLSINDVADAVAGALKEQKRDLLAHMQRRFELERVNANKSADDTRFRNLNHRLIQLESEVRQIKKERR